jgi:ribosomal protein S18 acetylase RimI-like enzyme
MGGYVPWSVALSHPLGLHLSAVFCAARSTLKFSGSRMIGMRRHGAIVQALCPGQALPGSRVRPVPGKNPPVPGGSLPGSCEYRVVLFSGVAPLTIADKIGGMKLVAADDALMHQVMGWFTDERSCRFWGGPDLRFPFTETSFREDTRFGMVPSFCLLTENGELVGFGQYYARAGRCHLSRLVISPGYRGRGYGGILIRELWNRARSELGFPECSLSVLAENQPAIRLYKRVGFVQQAYPDAMPGSVANCIYMVAPAPSGTL